MRNAPAFALCAALLMPAAAPASPEECENLARQLERFEGMAERAADGGNAIWEERMREHVEVLEERMAQRCSEEDLIASSTECQNLTATIAHYEEMGARAADQGHAEWEEKARGLAEGLAEERSERCPEWSAQAQANRAFMKMLKTAGELALTYFTMGAY